MSSACGRAHYGDVFVVMLGRMLRNPFIFDKNSHRTIAYGKNNRNFVLPKKESPR